MRGGGGRGDGRRLEERGAARRGPRRPTTQQHHCAPPSHASHTRTASRYPLPGAGRSPYQPHECQLAIAPPARRGGATWSTALAIKQLTIAGGPHAGARSSFQGVPDRQQRVARAPAAGPIAARLPAEGGDD